MISEGKSPDQQSFSMDTKQVNVRYMVNDVTKSADFYVKHLGFTIGRNAAPAFIDVTRGNLRLLLSSDKSSAGRPMPDGTQPVPGGWNRFELVVDDLEKEVKRLRGEGLQFRNDIVKGPGGSQILLIDPSGNFVELFQPL
jgi:catechol 2,3-dioxygenase-like lactoylglutathione lyase family enzyme